MVLSRRGCPLLRGFASAAAESRAVGLRSRLISSRLKDPLQSLHPLCLAIYVKNSTVGSACACSVLVPRFQLV